MYASALLSKLLRVDSTSAVQMARAARVELPRAALDFVCERCGALLVPSLSADVRVQPQSSRAPANRKLARARRRDVSSQGAPQRLVNVVVRGSGLVYLSRHKWF